MKKLNIITELESEIKELEKQRHFITNQVTGFSSTTTDTIASPSVNKLSYSFSDELKAAAETTYTYIKATLNQPEKTPKTTPFDTVLRVDTKWSILRAEIENITSLERPGARRVPQRAAISDFFKGSLDSYEKAYERLNNSAYDFIQIAGFNAFINSKVSLGINIEIDFIVALEYTQKISIFHAQHVLAKYITQMDSYKTFVDAVKNASEEEIAVLITNIGSSYRSMRELYSTCLGNSFVPINQLPILDVIKRTILFIAEYVNAGMIIAPAMLVQNKLELLYLIQRIKVNYPKVVLDPILTSLLDKGMQDFTSLEYMQILVIPQEQQVNIYCIDLSYSHVKAFYRILNVLYNKSNNNKKTLTRENTIIINNKAYDLALVTQMLDIPLEDFLLNLELESSLTN